MLDNLLFIPLKFKHNTSLQHLFKILKFLAKMQKNFLIMQLIDIVRSQQKNHHNVINIGWWKVNTRNCTKNLAQEFVGDFIAGNPCFYKVASKFFPDHIHVLSENFEDLVVWLASILVRQKLFVFEALLKYTSDDYYTLLLIEINFIVKFLVILN